MPKENAKTKKSEATYSKAENAQWHVFCFFLERETQTAKGQDIQIGETFSLKKVNARMCK